ncbi:hypothetical protein C7475_105164 [Chitinophaga sp. S165]|nr:hypothetical protein C7475_105164 [Chitinophaga sp. S165]
MKKAALYELWSALVAVFHMPDHHPRLARIYIYNNKGRVASRRF